MSIGKQIIRQRDFSAGEIDPDAQRRDDTEIHKYGCRRARNMQSLRTGGLENRYGRTFLYEDEGVRDDFRLLPNVTHSVTFAHLRATVRNSAGATVATLVAPWVTANIDALVWSSNDNMILITGPGMIPQVIEVNKATLAWSIRNYAFRVGLAGTINAPFYRFADQGITMQPSDITGSVTVTFSAPVLNPLHVGAVFRYAGKQLRLTGYTSPTVGTATCIEFLNHTVRYALTSGTEFNYSVGQIVQTTLSGVEGEVIAVDAANLWVYVVVLNRFRQSPTDDRLVGPSADGDIENAGGTLFVAAGATTQWDEQFMGAYRGWPRSVSKDVQRLIFTDFAQLKSGIVWSAVADPFDLQVTADANGAIFELIDADCQVFHVVGGYDEFAITDIGVFYIPISTDNPLAPGSVQFLKLYSGEVANVKPLEVTEGVLFVDESRTGVYAVTATGQQARPYVATEVSEFHRHLFNGIKSLGANSGTPQAAARQVYAVNTDGTVVIGQYNTERGYVGWLLWEGQGTVQSVSARFGSVVFSTSYDTTAGVIDVAERINAARELDCSVVYTGAASTLFLAGAAVQVMADGFNYGTMTVGVDGTVPLVGTFDEIIVGFEYDWSMSPNLADVDGGDAIGQRLRRRKVSKAVIKVRGTQQFRCGNRVLGGYRGGEDTALPMPSRDAVYQYREMGRSYDPQYELSKTLPGRFKLLELTTEITI